MTSVVLPRIFPVFIAVVILLSACNQGHDSAVDVSVMQPTISAVNTVKQAVPAKESTLPPVQSYGESHHGETTYYHATGKGNCSFDRSDDLMVTAINNQDYANAAMCGAYIAVSTPKGEVVVRVVDRCPGCKVGGLDLSKQAFEYIAETSDGRVPVTWKIVSGPVAGPVEYLYMDGSTRYWTAIQVRNHRWPVAKLEILPEQATKWIQVERRMYNYFVYPKPIAAGSLKVRVTSINGEVLEDALPEPAGGLLIQGRAQFH